MVTVMVMVILNCMLSWLPSGDGHMKWSYEMVILKCPRHCDCHSNELLSWRSGHGHGHCHDHCVYARRNGEFISNGDNRRSDHLLKTGMHFVKGPPHHLSCKLWNWFGPLCHIGVHIPKYNTVQYSKYIAYMQRDMIIFGTIQFAIY